MRRALTYAVGVVATVTLATGCDSGGSDQAASPTSVPSTAPASAPAAGPSPTQPSTGPAPTPTASPSKQPKPKPQKLKTGAKGARVVALQQRLTALGYWNGGKADGTFGGQTQQAVYALQKAAGLARDGVVGPKTQQALDQGVRPKARSSKGRVIEINLKRQLLMLVDDGAISQVFNTSTGSMEHYEQKGQTYLADTPSGKFRVSRQIDGWRHAPLGLLWRPKYFNGGIAVHGANSVPPYPASHGCARLSISAMNWLWNNDKIPIDTRVWVY